MAAAPRKERVMGVSVGLIELHHIPLGYETVDAMLKAADVELVRASPSCPGKFLAIVTGGVGAVECACAAAERTAGRQAVVCRAIDHLDEAVAEALKTRPRPDKLESFGSIETRTALSAILAADLVVKASRVRLICIRMAQGIGGKGYVNFTGDIASVRNAIETCKARCGDPSLITSSCAIATPHEALVSNLLR
mgnify:CR=1 FL=1